MNLKITFFRLQVGRASDVWSLGCILYQMVYGHTPFSALAFIQKMHAITDDKHRIAFPPVRNAALADTIRRCLDRNPRTRITMQVSTFCSTASGEGLHLHIVHVTPFAGLHSCVRGVQRHCSGCIRQCLELSPLACVAVQVRHSVLLKQFACALQRGSCCKLTANAALCCAGCTRNLVLLHIIMQVHPLTGLQSCKAVIRTRLSLPASLTAYPCHALHARQPSCKTAACAIL